MDPLIASEASAALDEAIKAEAEDDSEDESSSDSDVFSDDMRSSASSLTEGTETDEESNDNTVEGLPTTREIRTH